MLSMRATYVRALTKAGHQAHAVADGRRHRTTSWGGDPDVIVLDVRMPVMDGVTGKLDRLMTYNVGAGVQRRASI